MKYDHQNIVNHSRKGKGVFLPGKPKKKAQQHPIDESGPPIKVPKPKIIKEELIEVTIEQEDGSTFKLQVDKYTADNLQACIDNWLARTDEYTQQSLASYINSKDYAGCKAEIPKS